MSFTPNDAKLILETLSNVRPVLASSGSRKGEHVEKAFRFEFFSRARIRHISIPRKTKEGVTVYVNQSSSEELDFFMSSFEDVSVAQRYPRGFAGPSGEKGLSRAAASLSSLNPSHNDVLRLSIKSEFGFKKLLNWYNESNHVEMFSEQKQHIQDVNENLAPKQSIDRNGKESALDLNCDQADGAVTVQLLLQDSISLTLKGVEIEYENKPGTEVDAIVKRRIGQSTFRALLALRGGMACHITGLENSRLLIASHIVPWSKSSAEEKTDPENGLLLAVNWDAVFDKGFIYFDDDGQVVFSEVLGVESTNSLGLDRNARLSCSLLTEKRKAYLLRHRETYFESWTKPST